MIKKRWNFKPKAGEDEIAHLQRAINASRVLATILAQRGLKTFNDVKGFFTPSLRQLHDPFLMKNMDVAVHRITDAINREERILVYGDYDVDGTTAVALMYGFLTEQHDHVTYYIPDRYAEGYGVSIKGIDYAHDNGVDLIIALDCGVKAIEQVAYAKEKGIDFIICDHHLPGPELPDAVAILNPLQGGCDYPYKALCGCGIGFKLTQAMTKAWGLDVELPYKNIDLVAIATGADIVSMTGENRVLAHFGLRSMERVLRPGLAGLLEGSGLSENGRFVKREMTISDLVFKIGPLINAAGRMNHGSLAVELLTAPTQKKAVAYAEMLSIHNKERRTADERVEEEALEMIAAQPALQTSRSTVVWASHWHKGVIGIAASRLQDHYFRPTIVMTSANDKFSGSARSVPGFDVHAAIEECADLLESFGGHPAAAGLTLAPQNLESFVERFEQVVSTTITDDLLIPQIDVDLEIDLSEINEKLLTQINRLSPFGPGNMKPVFVSRNVIAAQGSRRVGEGSKHLKLVLQSENNARVRFDGIAFQWGHVWEELEHGDPFDLAYTLEWNEFRGKRTVQLMVQDIRAGSDKLAA